jgi:hypothetical protein
MARYEQGDSEDQVTQIIDSAAIIANLMVGKAMAHGSIGDVRQPV